MPGHPNAGLPADPKLLANIPRLVSDYFTVKPDVSDPSCLVSFGTSGHRGISSEGSFNEAHILAISQAVAEYRASEGICGPMFIGMDTHALSEPAFATALEVMAANGVNAVIQSGMTYTPTPVISHAILSHNRNLPESSPQRADGIIITPSHNPPEYGGFKYNPPTGGPASGSVTSRIQARANELLTTGLSEVRRTPINASKTHDLITHRDYISGYVGDLRNIIDMEAIAASGLKLGVNPLGGSTLDYWNAIGDMYGIDLTNTQPYTDPAFGFMTYDTDGKIRMDCSSPAAMTPLIAMRDRFDLAFANDPDGDRHGIVTRLGLMNPNHYLAVMIEYLYTSRRMWPRNLKVGKTLVSSAMIDRVCAGMGRELYEVPVGFKWFVDGLFSGIIGFGGEESAGASFLDMSGELWSTDKDGIIACLLGAEMAAKTGAGPAERHQAQVRKYGLPHYGRIQAPADAAVRKVLGSLSPDMIKSDTLAGEQISAILTNAPGNGAAIGGLKICAPNGWFAVRPSGTEDIYKIYAESFIGREHLDSILSQAVRTVCDIIDN